MDPSSFKKSLDSDEVVVEIDNNSSSNVTQHSNEMEAAEDSSNSSSSNSRTLCKRRSTRVVTPVLNRTKTRSRLMDPQPVKESSCRPKSVLLRSSAIIIRKTSSSSHFEEDDNDNPFTDDIPDDFKDGEFSVLTIVQWASFILILGALGCSLGIPSLKKHMVWGLHLWKWELMMLVLICGRLVSGWAIRLVVYCIELNLLLRKRVLYFVYGVRRAVQNCLWLGLVLLVWHLVFDEKVKSTSALPYVSRVLFCLLIAAVIRLVKILLVKVMASSFHVNTYFDRIQESLFNQYIIETLSGPPSTTTVEMRPNDLRAAATPERVIGGSGHGKSRELQEGITIDQLHRLNQKNITPWNMKRMMKIVRYGTLTILDEKVGSMNEEESAVQIRNEHEVMVAAKKIFKNVAKRGSKYIYLEDLRRFMREDEALKTMNMLEGSKDNNRVGRRCLMNWVVNAFRERRHLALTLNDTKTAVNKLHHMANFIVGIIILSIWLVILKMVDSHFFVVIGSQLVVAIFIFGNTLKTTFEAVIFLFVMHPFDVGDRCEINGVQMVVEEMNILTTIFLRYDNQKVTCPNSELATLFIGNFYRSPDMGDNIDFCIHVSTPVEKIAIMKQRIIGYMESRPEHWYPGPQVVFREVDDMNRLRISIWMRHTMNYQDMGKRFERRELVMQEMIKVLSELDIEYRMLPVDVNVRNLTELTSNRLPSTWKTACS